MLTRGGGDYGTAQQEALLYFLYVSRCLLRIDQTFASETYMPTPSPTHHKPDSQKIIMMLISHSP